MWVFTKYGCISIVTSENSPQMLLVRSRYASQIEAIFPNVHATETPSDDYRYRVLIAKPAVIQRLSELVGEIDYGNFNDAIGDRRYHDICVDVSSTLKKYQDKPHEPHPSDAFMP
jgi:hypothetical protein